MRVLLDEAVAGRLRIGLVRGEAGIGKSRLLSEALAVAEDRGYRIFLGRAEELEQRRPFGTLTDALACTRTSMDPRRAEIAGLITAEQLDEGRQITVTTDPGLQFRAIEAMVDLVEEEAIAGPALLAIDDLQWADPSTLVTLRSLSKRLSFLPVALILTLRPLPRSADLDALLDSLMRGGATGFALRPLDEAAVSRLVGDVVGAEPGRGLLAGVAGAAGNPLFVTEFLRALAEEGAIKEVEGRADVDEVTLPPTLRLTVLRRIGFLPEDTLAALRAASILGSRFSVADLAVTTSRPTSELAESLRGALAAGVLEGDGDNLRFRHDLVRDAIYEDISASARKSLHRDAARRLAAAGAQALQVAEHLTRGATPGDTEAVERLAKAAREAAPGSPALAAQLLEQAIEVAGPSSAVTDRLLAERVTNMLWSNQPRETEAICREILARAHDPSVEGILRSCLTQTLIGQGRAQETLAEVEHAIASAGLAESERLRIMAFGAHSKMFLADLDGAFEMARSVWSAAEASGDHLTTCIAMTCASMVEQLHGRFSEAVRIATDAVQLGDRSPHREGHRFQLGVFQGLFLMDLDRVADGIAALRRGARIGEELGARWILPLYQIGLIVGQFLAGNWDDAIAEFETALGLAEETGTRHGMVCNHSVRAMIALHRDDLDTAQRMTGVAEHEFAETGPQYRVDWAMWARALLLEANGSPREAYGVLAGAWDLCAGAGMLSELPVLGPDLVRLALASGRRPRAEDVTIAVEDISSKEESPWLAGAALLCRGLLEDDPETLLAAVDAYRTSPRPLERAQASEAAGEGLARAGKHDDARRLLEDALTRYATLEAFRDVARTEAALRAFGVRRGSRGTRGRPKIGWESLTETEQRVVALVTEGLTNPQISERLFVSPRTVQTHLTHVFAKLNMTSRTELAAQAARRE